MRFFVLHTQLHTCIYTCMFIKIGTQEKNKLLKPKLILHHDVKLLLLASNWLKRLKQCSSWVGKRTGCKRNWTQSSARTTKIRAQFSAQTTQNRTQFRARMTKWGTLLRVNDQNLVTIQRANETRSVQFCGRLMKTRAKICKQLQAFWYQLSENTKTAITFLQKKK